MHLGDAVRKDLPDTDAGKYEVFVNLTKAIDYGIAQFYLIETKLGGAVDLYNRSVITTGNKSLGKIMLKKARSLARLWRTRDDKGYTAE